MSMRDLIIIGAGPAGMAAAIVAARAGATVTLLDEQPSLGGQIYRGVTTANARRSQFLGNDYLAGQTLTSALAETSVEHIAGATVWGADSDGHVTYSRADAAHQIRGRNLIIATGALERPMPIPGWTLPGVITAGAAQILLKSAGLVSDNAVLVGSGPLLYLLAAQMIAAGAPPRALVETQTRSDTRAALRHIGGAMRGWRNLHKGLHLLRTIQRAKIPRYTGAQAIEVLGDHAATSVRFKTQNKVHEIATTSVLLHQGVVPNTQITRALRLDHHWDAAQHCFHPTTTEWGETSTSNIYVAGDGAAINGAKAAEYAGQISALQTLHQLGHLTAAARDTSAAPLRAALASEGAVRPFLDRMYPPEPETRRPADATIVCRCEDVTAGDIRAYARLGCTGPNQTKAFGRCGMGPCQGRYCALTVTEILAAETGQTQQDTGSYRIRQPLKPVTLGEVASISFPQD